jgi:hypothetical protein
LSITDERTRVKRAVLTRLVPRTVYTDPTGRSRRLHGCAPAECALDHAVETIILRVTIR